MTVSTPPLPSGTVKWSNPGDGSGVAAIIRAVPSATGLADVFALQNDGTVQAMTGDGITVWSLAVPDAAAPNGSSVSLMPDFQGGLVITDYLANGGNGSIVKVDGITGQPYPAYNLAAPTPDFFGLTVFSNGAAAVHTDGTIFAFEGNSVIGINPTTGTQKFSVPIAIPQPALNSYSWNCMNSGTSYGLYLLSSTNSGLIVAGDGNAYVAFAYNEFNGCVIAETHVRLLQISSSGASNVLTILDANPFGGYTPDAILLRLGLITNADTGVLLTWGLDPIQGEVSYPTQYGMAITTGTSVSFVNAPSVPGQPNMGSVAAVFPVLQAQDGSFIGSVFLTQSMPFSQQWNMVAFDQGGNVRWMVPNEQPMIATADGGDRAVRDHL